MPYRDEQLALLQREQALAEQLAGIRTRLTDLRRQRHHPVRLSARFFGALLAASALAALAVPAAALLMLRASVTPSPGALDGLLVRLIIDHASIPSPSPYLVDDIVSGFGVQPEPPPRHRRVNRCRLSPPDRAQITPLGEHEFEVSSSLIDHLLDTTPQLHSGGRIVPHHEDGKVVCVKIYGLRPKSIWRDLGLRSGDCLESLNDYSLSNPQQALEAYAAMRLTPYLDLGCAGVVAN